MIKQKYKFWGRNPLTIVEFIIAIASIVAGIYIVSPALAYSTSVNGAGTLVALLGHPYAIIAYGAIYLISGLIILAGIYKRKYKWRSIGLFTNLCIRIYGLVGVFLINGLLPLSWLSSLTVIFITLVCYLTVRGFIHRGLSA